VGEHSTGVHIGYWVDEAHGGCQSGKQEGFRGPVFP